MKIAWHMPTLRTHTCGLSIRATEFAARLCEQAHEVTFFVDAAKADVAGDVIRGMPLVRLDLPFLRPMHWCLQALTRRRRAGIAVEQLGDDWDLVVSCQPEFVAAYGRQKQRASLLYVCGSTTLHHDAADVASQSSLGLQRRVPFAIDRWLKRANEQRAFVAADAAVFDSEQTRELVISQYAIAADKCHTVRGGVDADRFVPTSIEEKAAARRHLGIEPDSRVIVWTGRMSPEKNLALLLDAAARIRGEKVRILLVGDGPLRASLEDHVSSLGLKGMIRFVGACSDVRTYLRAGDIFAFPSRSESFGCSLAEAMACGLPIVALRPTDETIRNASIEVVEDGACGLLANEPTPVAFARQLRCLCDDASLCGRLGNAARAWAMRYDWRSGAAQLDALLGTLVPGRTAAGGNIRVNSRSTQPSASVVVG